MCSVYATPKLVNPFPKQSFANCPFAMSSVPTKADPSADSGRGFQRKVHTSASSGGGVDLQDLPDSSPQPEAPSGDGGDLHRGADPRAESRVVFGRPERDRRRCGAP